MRKPSLSELVYSATFPRPRTTDPASFSAHITRNLVPEVRIETSTFYGSLDCIEAQYPGLDYACHPHRLRLGRFPWHRKLFKVFDELGLTDSEIASLCRWEGTKSARQRYEAEEGVVVRDTTAETVRPQSPVQPPSVEVHFDAQTDPTKENEGADEDKDEGRRQAEEELPAERTPAEVPPTEPSLYICTEVSDPASSLSLSSSSSSSVTVQQPEPEKDEEEDNRQEPEPESESDSASVSSDEIESYGVALNDRLLAATAARDQGADVPLDELWEQWLKEATERGNYTDMMEAIRSNQPLRYDASASRLHAANASSNTPNNSTSNLTTTNSNSVVSLAPSTSAASMLNLISMPAPQESVLASNPAAV